MYIFVHMYISWYTNPVLTVFLCHGIFQHPKQARGQPGATNPCEISLEKTDVVGTRWFHGMPLFMVIGEYEGIIPSP